LACSGNDTVQKTLSTIYESSRWITNRKSQCSSRAGKNRPHIRQRKDLRPGAHLGSGVSHRVCGQRVTCL